jgi:hypothetical protein
MLVFCQCDGCCDETDEDDTLDVVESWYWRGDGEMGALYENVDEPVLTDEGDVGARWWWEDEECVPGERVAARRSEALSGVLSRLRTVR